MTSRSLSSLVRNPFFLARVYGPVAGVDIDALLEVSDEHVNELDDLCNAFGRSLVDDEDEELVTRCIAVPIHLTASDRWDVEHHDNGEDAGVTHTLHTSDSEPITISEIDAHPRGVRLRWNDAARILEAARADARNAPIADALLLLFRSLIVLDEVADVDEIRTQVAAAWQHCGASPQAADELAMASIRRSAGPWPDDDLREANTAIARLLGRVAPT